MTKSRQTILIASAVIISLCLILIFHSSNKIYSIHNQENLVNNNLDTDLMMEATTSAKIIKKSHYYPCI